MDSNTPSKSTFSANRGLDKDVDDPNFSLLSMGRPFESTSMPIISAIIFLLDLPLGLVDSHITTSFCEWV